MKTHFEMIDAANEAKTEHEHNRAMSELDGWRKGREWSGIEADIYTMLKYGESRPMCCGVLLDWEPNDGGKRSDD